MLGLQLYFLGGIGLRGRKVHKNVKCVPRCRMASVTGEKAQRAVYSLAVVPCKGFSVALPAFMSIVTLCTECKRTVSVRTFSKLKRHLLPGCCYPCYITRVPIVNAFLL